MSCWHKTKLIGPLLVFNILLPTWDVFSDVKLTANLFKGENQNCSKEEENVQAFRQKLDLCLNNPQKYCQSDSDTSFFCQEDLSCMKCSPVIFVPGLPYVDCVSSDQGIREIYNQCLNNSDNYCSNPNTYHGICQEVTRRYYKFGILLLGNCCRE